jgi:hypothetical protein
LVDDLHRWFHSTLGQLSRKSPVALAIRYALTAGWHSLVIAMTAASNSRTTLPSVPCDRSQELLFLGADSGGERAAAIYSLIGTAKLIRLIG